MKNNSAVFRVRVGERGGVQGRSKRRGSGEHSDIDLDLARRSEGGGGGLLRLPPQSIFDRGLGLHIKPRGRHTGMKISIFKLCRI